MNSPDDSVYGAPAPLVIGLVPIDIAPGAAPAAIEAWLAAQAFHLGPHHATAREVALQTQALYARTGAAAPWLGYFATADRQLVGSCGFVGNPGAEGEVEIAYFTFPGGEGRGCATLMAGALVEIARRAGAARVVAHTLPERNASCRVLERNGFARAGEGHDAEVGPTWRWARAL